MMAGQYKREAREAATATGRISSQMGGVSKAGDAARRSLTQAGKAIVGVFAARALIQGVGQAIDRAETLNSAYAITEQVIRQTGGAANLAADDIKKLSREQSLLTGVDKALIVESNNILLTFKNIREEVGEGNNIFSRASTLMLDVAATMGTNATSAALQLGKALNDPIVGMTALQRAGLTFSAQQKAQIRQLVDNNDLLSAQKLILTELESQLGGTAAASADATDKIANQFKELQEGFGNLVLPLVEQLNVELLKLSGDTLGALAAQTGQNRRSAALLAGALNQLAGEFDDFEREERGGRDALDDFGQGARELIDTAGLADSELRKLRDGLPFLVENFDLTQQQANLLAEAIGEQLVPTTAEMAANAAGLEAELAALHGTTGDVTAATIEYKTSVEALEFAEERQRKATKAARDALLAKRDALRTIHDPLFAMVSLNNDLAESEAAVEEASKKGVASPEYRDAVLDRARVIADLETTLIDLRTQGIDPTGVAAAEMLKGLGIPPNVIAEIFNQFDALQTDFEGRTFRATLSIPGFGFNDSGVAVRTGTQIFRQHGGPVTAGRPYVIGEAGPELFVPSQSGHVVANQNMGGQAAAVTTVNVFTLTWGDYLQKANKAGIDIQRLGW
jgi:hypothetical protein